MRARGVNNMKNYKIAVAGTGARDTTITKGFWRLDSFDKSVYLLIGSGEAEIQRLYVGGFGVALF